MYVPDDPETMVFSNDAVIVIVISKDELRSPKDNRDAAIDTPLSVNICD